jgi:DNA-binding NarL/FixJ family response regulator
MIQRKVVILAESDDGLCSMIEGAMAAAGTGHTLFRVAPQAGDRNLLSAGWAAQNLLRNVPYIVVLDADCMEDAGRNTISRMKEDGLLARIPVIVLTASGDMRRLGEYQALGVSACIVKSGDAGRLRDTMSRLSDFLSVVQIPQF